METLRLHDEAVDRCRSHGVWFDAGELQAVPEGAAVLPYSADRRGAWYSFGYLVRAAAAKLLDVSYKTLLAKIKETGLGD